MKPFDRGHLAGICQMISVTMFAGALNRTCVPPLLPPWACGLLAAFALWGTVWALATRDHK